VCEQGKLFLPCRPLRLRQHDKLNQDLEMKTNIASVPSDAMSTMNEGNKSIK